MNQRTRLPLSALLLTLIAMLASTVGAGAAAARHTTSAPTRGGTIEIAFSDDMTNFDAAQAYSSDWTVMNGTLYNGLYQFDCNGVPQLDLAASAPVVSADRKVWTFHLRKGVRFSNGLPMTAEDLKYSIMRTLDPTLKPSVSWGQITDEIFTGSTAFAAGKSKTVSGIQVLDPYTIRFVLTQPIAILPYILAESFNFVVPKAIVSKESADTFGNHPIGTGPFMLQSWQKGVKVVFVRNPYYFRAGKPYLDKVIVDVNVAPNVIALKVEKGELAGFGTANQLAAADLQQARNDPRYASYLLDTPTAQADWFNVDVHVAPLTNQKLRQALAMAIDRVRLVKLLGGKAIPASQIYLPLDPQYDPSLATHPIYPYDPTKAAALVKSSGYHGQLITLDYYNNLQDMIALAPGLLQDFQQVGLNVAIRGVGHNSLLQIAGALNGTQISTAFWLADYFDGYDVYSGALSCGANGVGGEGSHYCNAAADDLSNRAEALPLGPARNALLRQAQIRVLQAAAQIPLVYVKSTEMVSPKVGGFYYQPYFNWQFENYWLKR